jgi:hypothetical protein
LLLISTPTGNIDLWRRNANLIFPLSAQAMPYHLKVVIGNTLTKKNQRLQGVTPPPSVCFGLSTDVVTGSRSTPDVGAKFCVVDGSNRYQTARINGNPSKVTVVTCFKPSGIAKVSATMRTSPDEDVTPLGIVSRFVAVKPGSSVTVALGVVNDGRVVA